MQAACRRLGRTAGLLLLTAVVAGCGTQAQPPARTPPQNESKNPAAAAPQSPPPATTPKQATRAKPATPAKSTGTSAVAKAAKSTPAAPDKAAPTAAPKAAKTTTVKKAKVAPPKQGEVLLRAAEPEEKEDPEADKQLGYSVVKVYYATDRATVDVFQWRKSLQAGWPMLTFVFAIIAIGR